jgi:hypothetical protein
VSLPLRSEFRTPNEVLVEVAPGQTPDGLGRVRFTAYWLDDATPTGVRGQVFRTNLSQFAAREACPVHLISPAGVVDETRPSVASRPGLAT